MKPFDLEAAKRGEPIVTRDGRPAKFVAYVPELRNQKVLVVVDGHICIFSEKGEYFNNKDNSVYDLFMAPQPMRSINGHEYPEPVREPLEDGQGYWLVDLTDRVGVSDGNWNYTEYEFMWLDRGLIQLTEEGARQQLKAMLAALCGEV